MNRQIRPHPSPLPKGEGTRILAPLSLGRGVGGEGHSYHYSATPTYLTACPRKEDVVDRVESKCYL
ncbi:MAG: hypothetical protein LH660_13630 [Phormidesmis sp. CAN_BIN36]|nr:hypothetical protein [Phormidesmis sp. CAN_BIN36]